MSEEPRNCKYKFKSNPVITYKKQKFSNANLTDEAAEGWVKENPSRVAHFDLKSRELLKEFLKPKKKANKKAKEETKEDSSGE